MTNLTLQPALRAAGAITVPGSKSVSNRVLLLAALASGKTTIRNLLASDDTDVMINALGRLGVTIHKHAESFDVEGVNGSFNDADADLFLGNAGTAVRMLTAIAAVSGGSSRIHGVPRMHQRPIGDLVDTLRELGADIRYEQNDGYPPLIIEAKELDVPSKITIKGNVSSQFLTALLMMLPVIKGDRTIEVDVDGVLISQPYIDITLTLMREFGANAHRRSASAFCVQLGTGYQSPGSVYVEADASSASYFFAAGAIGGGPVRVLGVGEASIQGDIKFAKVLQDMGALVHFEKDWIEVAGPTEPMQKLKGITIDANDFPDAAMTLSVVALFCDGPTRIENIASWRVKETDRLAAMAEGLIRLGATVHEGHDYLEITPPLELKNDVVINSFDDHRVAMAFSLASLRGVSLTILDSECVAKTFPTYFSVFETLCK